MCYGDSLLIDDGFVISGNLQFEPSTNEKRQHGCYGRSTRSVAVVLAVSVHHAWADGGDSAAYCGVAVPQQADSSGVCENIGFWQRERLIVCGCVAVIITST